MPQWDYIVPFNGVGSNGCPTTALAGLMRAEFRAQLAIYDGFTLDVLLFSLRDSTNLVRKIWRLERSV